MTTDRFAERRARVLQNLGGGVLILPSTPVARRNGDAEHPYRASSDLLYLSNFREPSCVLVLSAVSPKAFTLFVQPRDPKAETWTGRRAGVEGAVRDYGADQAFSIDDLDKELGKLLAGAQTLWTPLGVDPAWDERILRVVSRVRASSRTGVQVPWRIHDPTPLLSELRLIKDETEIEHLRRASALTREGFLRAMKATRAGVAEYELEAEMLHAFRTGGGEAPGYEPIVAAGVNGTILHYRTGRDVLQSGELVLVDCGCEVEAGYTADVTRTWPVDGKFTAPQRALYETVLDAHAQAVAAVRPGVTRDAVHEVATRALIRGLVRLGLLQGDEDALFVDKSDDSYRRYYMHSTGHWLGLDVHDAGAYHVTGTSRPLVEGIVLTIEPGLYIAQNDEKAPAEYRGIGIRIEDDVLVTRTGGEILTVGIPREVEELEKVRAP